MKNLIAGFSKQLREAMEIGKKAKFTSPAVQITNVLISGLGGSGIGGSIAAELMINESKIPINVSKGYFIPEYVDQHTLFIASSYSGNTEETINALELALKKNAKIVCITSGGTIEAIAKKNQLDHVIIPGGMPPRSCLGYSLTQLFYALNSFNIISRKFELELDKAIALIDKEENNILSEAKTIADKLENKIPVIYSTTYSEAVSIRFRQQINENSKMLCWHHVIPEMNHNELVGWREKNEKLAVVLFRDIDDYSRNKARIEINKEIIKQYTSTIMEVFSKGTTAIEKTIYFIHLGDWISYFLAEKKGVDAVEVSVINHLKSELSKL